MSIRMDRGRGKWLRHRLLWKKTQAHQSWSLPSLQGEIQWRNRQSAPLTFFSRKFLLTYWENRGKEKKGKWRRKEVKFWKGRGELKMEVEEVWNCTEDFFFFFLLFTFWNHWNFFGCTKMGIPTEEKANFTPGRNLEKWHCPLWKIFLLCHWWDI